MRNPARKIIIYLALVLLGVALAMYGISTEKRIGEAWTSTGFTLGGIVIAPIAFLLLIRALFNTWGRAKLVAGQDVLARWHLSADEWERFTAFDRARDEQDYRLVNNLRPDGARLQRGIDVIIGKKSALIGDSYHVLRKGGIPGLTTIQWLTAPADPECLEFGIVYPRHRTAHLYMAFRFPFPATARGDARRVYDHFEPLLRSQPALALQNPNSTIKIALGVALAAAAAAAWGLWRAKTGHSDEVAALVAAVAGSIVALAALLVALMTAKSARRSG
jgi:hypothetical protein